MFIPSLARARRFSRDLWAAREGATAVEFALVILPFCFIMFAILELGLVFVLDSVLENATIDTGRLVRTGRANAQAMNAEAFETALCGRMSIFSSGCAAKVHVDVREIQVFNTTAPDPMEGGTFSDANLRYTNGGPGSLMLVRVWYEHTLVTPFLSQGLSRLNNGKAMLVATTAFRNEP